MTGGGSPLGPGREFDIIRDLVQRWGDRAAGIGDDAALLDPPAGEKLVISTDSSIEGVHFRREWLTPGEIGYRAATAALSDLAAMAAEPRGVLVALGVPGRWLPELGELADGIGEAVATVGTRILGGDLTSAGELSICVTVVGLTNAPLPRAGAAPGDAIYVTGTLGGPLAAVRAWERGDEPASAHRARFARPAARIREALWLAARGAHAAIDISDGLLSDLAHVAAASGVRIVVELERVPRADGIDAGDAARSGEEYELAVAAPEGLDTAAFEAELGVPLTVIGRVEAGPAGIEAVMHGVRVAPGGGWDHFST